MFVCAAALMATGAHAGGMMTRFDANKDGKITAQEADAAHAARFAKMDLNKDGFIDASEARNAKKDRWEKMKERRAAKDGGKRMDGRAGGYGMMAADANGDGKITKAEYDAAAMGKGSFEDKDFNKDGVIDKADWDARKAACDAGAALCGPLARMDENKDGKVSKAEFMSKPGPMFERMDANKDGVIDQPEMAAAKAWKGHKHGSGGPGMDPGAPPPQ
jgi:Ca2+-binding EF-hand superfamily protein